MQFVVSVIVDLPLRQSYSYLALTKLGRGSRVIVEFRKRHQVAFVVSCSNAADYSEYPLDKLSPILEYSDPAYTISEHIWQLAEFTANYYHHPLGSTLFSAVPSLLRKIGKPKPAGEDSAFYRRTSTEISKIRSGKQRACLELLSQQVLTTQQCKKILATANYAELLAKWLSLGWLELVASPPPGHSQGARLLNPEQAHIVTEIVKHAASYHPCLLYGITGSGKTEVFLHIISQVLNKGQQVLVLVPEINLTPQLAARFAERFPYAKCCFLNSEIGDKQRLNGWLAAKNHQAQIIIGTRLAVFTPCANLGLIIVDEEHDNSFKQNDGLRYHARDLAVWRAKTLQLPIILASATPALETLYNFKQGKYQLYKLTRRANQNAELPQIKLVNLQHYPVNFAGISQIALDKLAECLERKELALIFINRRGYAPIISCYDCGWVSSCRYCSSKMVYHHDKHKLQCHHCSSQIAVPKECPECHNQYLHTIGHGTQKLEQFLAQHFPQARIKRVDRDTTNTKKAWNNLYQQIEQHQVDILVGTQMLAKGHDFANLTLVIGLNLDNALYSYDFRASEDMYNTLTQVAGRAGRDQKPGLVLLQSNYPDHPLYKFLIEHDFNGFINYTLNERRLSNLPPFSYYALVKLSHDNEAKLAQAMQRLKTISKSIPQPQLTIFAPVAAVLPKLHNKFRGQMLISTNQRAGLHRYLAELEPRLAELAVVCAIDVDPFEL